MICRTTPSESSYLHRAGHRFGLVGDITDWITTTARRDSRAAGLETDFYASHALDPQTSNATVTPHSRHHSDTITAAITAATTITAAAIAAPP